MENTTDLTLRTDRVGNMITGKRGEYVCNVAQMLFNMVPGTDEYEPKRGLNVKGKLQQTYMENSRDSAYESEIMQQFTQYTDLIPVNVVVLFKDKSLYIYMADKYQEMIYQIDVTADKNSLTAMLRNNQ